MRDRPALGRVLAFGLDGNGVAAEDVKLAFREGLLVQLAAFRGRRNRVEDSRVGDARFGVVRDQLVSVDGDANTGVARPGWHLGPPGDGLAWG